MKRKLFLLLCALLTMIGVQAQTDVTSTYITNANFSSTGGWTQTHSSQYWTLGNGLIGTYAVANNKTSTTDATHLATEYCFGIQCRWQTNYAAFTQDTPTLPVGAYTLTFDVQNTNTSTTAATYENRFKVTVGGNTYTDSKTEWMSGNSAWTTHTISFSVTEEAQATISLGYGTGSNNLGTGNTPHLYVSHLKLTWTDPNLAAAQVKLGGYIKKATALNEVFDDSDLETAISTAQTVLNSATTADECNTASSNLSAAITTALSGKTPVSLTNGDFNTTPNNTLNGDKSTTFGGTLSISTSNPDNTKDMSANTGDHAYLYDVTGWTQYSKFNSTAAQGTTSEYGTAMPANGWSTNSTTPPASDMFGETAGAALHLSAGWSDQARYQQTIANLPSGRYVLYYEVINKHSNTGIAYNYIGVNGTSGDFYGTTDSYKYSDLATIEQDVWKAQAFEFDVAKTANINFSAGVTTSTSGSGNGAKLWIDNILVYRIADIIVTEEDANAIIESAEALDDVTFNATDKANLAEKLSDFKAAKNIDNYNALNAAIIQANASKDVYTTLDAAITNVEAWTATTATAGIRSKYNSGNYSNETTAANIYAEYQAAEISALAADGSAVDWTSVILNASFETGDMTGWSAESRNDTGVKDQSNGTYSITSGDPVDGSKLFNSWGGTAENNVYQTIKNLPAGTYTLTALVAGFKDEELVLSANETTSSVTVKGDKTVGYTVDVKFTLDATGDVVIKASNTKDSENSDASFIKADNFKLYKGDVMTDNYAALNAAIGAAEANTLGFDKDEYAPYNNVEALSALSNAKAVDQEKKIAQPLLDGIVSNLTSATWTPNATDVDPVFNGSFSSDVEGDWGLTGWTRTNGWGQQQTGVSGDYATAYYNHPGSLQYGNKGTYSMPLKAYQVYKLTFAYRSHENGSNTKMTVSVLNAENEGLAATDYPGNSSNTEWAVITTYFTTVTAGDYVLTLANSGNTWITGVSIEKLPNTVPATIGENGYTTFASAYPLDLTQANLPVGVKAYKATTINSSYVHFEKLNQVVPANTGVLLEGAAGPHNIRVGSEVAEVTDNLFLVNETNDVFPAEENTTYYAMVKNSTPMTFGKFDPSVVAVPFYKAYLKVNGGSQARLTVMFDGEDPTAINAIEAAEAEDGVLKDGKYLIDGKIVLVKNGVKYGANGQILK